MYSAAKTSGSAARALATVLHLTPLPGLLLRHTQVATQCLLCVSRRDATLDARSTTRNAAQKGTVCRVGARSAPRYAGQLTSTSTSVRSDRFSTARVLSCLPADRGNALANGLPLERLSLGVGVWFISNITSKSSPEQSERVGSPSSSYEPRTDPLVGGAAGTSSTSTSVISIRSPRSPEMKSGPAPLSLASCKSVESSEPNETA
mmetsp:Transcript_18087/g.46245  ORF Transcript_18087/g.46245 Transcript_18087/m.46245 type:complete len:205 (-) Transcript_18087:308-922(-)